MPESRFPPSLSAKNVAPQPRQAGYVRSGVTHLTSEWSFDLLDDELKVAVATIETADGPVHIGMSRPSATEMLHTLQLFLADWPERKPLS